MPPRDDDDDYEPQPASRAIKKIRTAALAPEAQSSPSSVTRSASAAECQMTQAQLLDFYDDPWSYSLKQVEIVKSRSKAELDLVPDKMWSQTSWQISARVYIEPRNRVPDLIKRCAVTHAFGEQFQTDAAHLVPARREEMGSTTVYHGLVDVDLLKRAQVVPEHAHINSQANRIQLTTNIHKDFDARRLDMHPNQDQVVARLLCEIKYQAERAAVGSSSAHDEVTVKLPARPPFDKFYDAAEKKGACFRLIASNRRVSPYIVWWDNEHSTTTYTLEGITQDDPLRLVLPGAEKPSPDKPVLPSLIEPASMNMLIWAMHDRVERSSPYSEEIQHETLTLHQFIKLLLAFWFLNDETPAADIAKLVERAKVFVKEHGGPGRAEHVANLAATSYTDIVNAVALPPNALRSQDPRTTPEQRATVLAAAAAYDEVSASSDDFSDLDFPDS